MAHPSSDPVVTAGAMMRTTSSDSAPAGDEEERISETFTSCNYTNAENSPLCPIANGQQADDCAALDNVAHLVHQQSYSVIDRSVFNKSLAHSIGEAFEPTPFPSNHQHSRNKNEAPISAPAAVQRRRSPLHTVLDQVAHVLGSNVDEEPSIAATSVSDGSIKSSVPSSIAFFYAAATNPSGGAKAAPLNDYSTAPEQQRTSDIIDNWRRPSSVLPHHQQRSHQQSQWDDRYQAFVRFQQKYGNCCVPNDCETYADLSRWVKRQRYQYKQLQDGKSSTLSVYRLKKLKQISFVWDAHASAWDERLNELKDYCKKYGHCNVPNRYQDNPRLATWVKSQRRQYKLYVSGKKSHMTPGRIVALEEMQFQWEIRKTTPHSSTSSTDHTFSFPNGKEEV